jgi:hypothetical protein
MAVEWKWYVRRVRLDVEKWLVNKGICDYGSFVEVLKKENIIPPPEESVKHHFDSLFPSQEKVKAAEEKVKVETVKKKWGIVDKPQAKKKKKAQPAKKKSSKSSEPVEDSLYHDG